MAFLPLLFQGQSLSPQDRTALLADIRKAGLTPIGGDDEDGPVVRNGRLYVDGSIVFRKGDAVTCAAPAIADTKPDTPPQPDWGPNRVGPDCMVNGTIPTMLPQHAAAMADLDREFARHQAPSPTH